MSTAPCRFFFATVADGGRGGCTNGKSCRFSHDKESQTTAAAPPKTSAGPGSIKAKCRYLPNCSAGLSCPFLHSDYESDERERRNRWLRQQKKTEQTQQTKPPTQRPISTSHTAPPPAPTPLPPPSITESAWVLPGDSDGATFYGAPGLAPTTSTATTALALHRPSPVSSALPATKTSAVNTAAMPCPLFSRGGCQFGDACRFSHALAPPPVAKTSAVNTAAMPCPFFSRGGCQFGETCRFSHAKTLPPPPTNTTDCGICLETVTAKFGVLQNCSHTFHYHCIASWRATGESSLSSVRSCPLCRAPSHYIIPSPSPATSPAAKRTLVAAHKLICAKKNCAKFDFNRGHCPHGTSCFYRHVDLRGEKVVAPPVRVKQDDEGAVKGISEIKLDGFL